MSCRLFHAVTWRQEEERLGCPVTLLFAVCEDLGGKHLLGARSDPSCAIHLLSNDNHPETRKTLKESGSWVSSFFQLVSLPTLS